MSESTPHFPDDLDTGWDDSGPTDKRLVAVSSAPAISDIDDGWDLAGLASPLHGDGGDAPTVGSTQGAAVPTSHHKQQLRGLKRQARAHQLKRDAENKAKRKASPKTQRQRELVTDHRPSGVSHRQSAEERSTMSNPQSKGSKRKAKASKRHETGSKVTTEPASQAAPSVTAAATNRAMRRAGTASATPARHAANVPEKLRSSKRPSIGPFTLFIGVVLVASIFSYLFIR